MARHVVRQTAYDQARALATGLLGAPDAGTVRRRVRDWCDEQYGSDFYGDVEV
jgi:hypothetical protein